MIVRYTGKWEYAEMFMRKESSTEFKTFYMGCIFPLTHRTNYSSIFLIDVSNITTRL